MIITITDVIAKDVKKIVTDNPSYLDRTQAYYDQLMIDYGVNETPATPWSLVKEHLLEYLYLIVYRDAIGIDIQTLVNGAQVDSYADKYKIIKESFDNTRGKLTFEILSGIKVAKGVMSGNIRRG